MAESEQHIKDPPPYESSGSPPDISAAFSKLNLSSQDAVPTVDECIAHLKLLEAFAQLKEDITTRDSLYGIQDSFVPEGAPDKTKTEILSQIREKRWAIFVTIAATRFQAWFKSIQPESKCITLETMANDAAYNQITNQSVRLNMSTDELPPLGKLI
jgi:hypothetical protein